MLVSRISRRVLAEHHITLSDSLDSKNADANDHVGIIHTRLNVKNSIDRCAQILRRRFFSMEGDFDEKSTHSDILSDVIVDGHLDTEFAFIREHLE